MKRIALLSYGCAKNLVDSELIFGLLADNGYEITLDETKADIVIVNTCSFIRDAERESVRSVLELVNAGKKVVVAGCLAQRYGSKLKKYIPEISAAIGTSDFTKLITVIEALEKGEDYVEKVRKIPVYIYPENINRQQITAGASTYVKIADGCNYRCGYCVIPQLRGTYHSRKQEDIIKEVNSLIEKGVSEIILVAQDTTSYGIDLYNRPVLPELLQKLNKLDGLNWIRFMYAHPSRVTDELLLTMAKCEKVVKYIDIPLQHSHPDVLRRMNRPVFDYRLLIENIRKKVEGIAVRTTFITGYPGETKEEFQHLYNFIKDMKFEKMGVFEYSREKGTLSYNMKPLVPKKVMRERFEKLMKLQKKISKKINKSHVGKVMPCIIENITDDGCLTARTQYDAPDIDGLVYIKTDKHTVPGDIYNVKITGYDEYDLTGIL